MCIQLYIKYYLKKICVYQRATGDYCLMGREPVWDDGKVMEVHSGDDCTAMQMHLMPPRQILFYVYYIYTYDVCSQHERFKGHVPT